MQAISQWAIFIHLLKRLSKVICNATQLESNIVAILYISFLYKS